MPVLTPRAFNQLEVVLWLLFGVVFAFRGIRDASVRRQALILAITFLLFAGSDAVEVHTGAWWRPWWLLVWKGACVLTLAGMWWTWPGKAEDLSQSPSDDAVSPAQSPSSDTPPVDRPPQSTPPD